MTRSSLLKPLPPRLAAAVLALALQAAAAAPLDDLRRQVETSQFPQAWATVQANPQLVGDVHFDFLYGVTAINVGRVAEGLLALERHLAAVPANDRARLELARGYFLLGEYARARAEFEFVLRYNPPAGVRTTIAGFLQAMQQREQAGRRSSARFYAEASGGKDTNVNGGTFRDEVPMAFGTMNLLEGTSRRVGDTFKQLALGGQSQLQVSPRLGVFAGYDLSLRANNHADEFDIGFASLNAGFTQLGGGALWRLSLSANEIQVGHHRYRSTLQLVGDATFNLGQDNTLTPFVQVGEQRHAVADEARNARLSTLGGQFTANFSQWPGQPQLALRLFHTVEQNLRGRRDFSRDHTGLRITAAMNPLPPLRLNVAVSAETQRYGAEDPVFGSLRKDDTLTLESGATWNFDARWSLRAEGFWTRVRSNQDLYDQDRKVAALKLRYQY